MTKIIACFCAALLLTASKLSAKPIPLWPNGAPDDNSAIIGSEQDTSAPGKGLVAGKPVIRLSNVSIPTITVYPAPKDKANGTAVLVCPGGGYKILAWDLEGTEICEWFNSLGVTAVLLKYRVPTRAGDERHKLPLQDVQRALGLVRSHAKDWNLDAKRIGILGFSAGGHLTADLCSNYGKREYTPVDDADQLSCRPDFALLIYPAYLLLEHQKDKLAPELNVTSNTPPTFIMQAEDDQLGPEGSLAYYGALKTAKVPAELHLYPTGGHGYGMRPSDKPVSTWPKRAEEWMSRAGLLGPKSP